MLQGPKANVEQAVRRLRMGNAGDFRILQNHLQDQRAVLLNSLAVVADEAKIRQFQGGVQVLQDVLLALEPPEPRSP
jgi:hypothetical protein